MSAGLFGSYSVIQINTQLQLKITPKYFNCRSTSEVSCWYLIGKKVKREEEEKRMEEQEALGEKGRGGQEKKKASILRKVIKNILIYKKNNELN